MRTASKVLVPFWILQIAAVVQRRQQLCEILNAAIQQRSDSVARRGFFSGSGFFTPSSK